MKHWLMMVLAMSAALLAVVAQADEYAVATERFRQAGAGPMLDTAHAYAVFPTIGKGGIGIGGAYGEGRVFVGGTEIGTTSMTQLSVGFQLGGQAFSQLILFQDARALEDFTSGSFEFSAQASAVALTAAAGAEAGSKGSGTTLSGGQNDAAINSWGYHRGMAVFTIAKGGLMYEASIGGQKFDYSPYRK